jgi:hypothetical protein
MPRRLGRHPMTHPNRIAIVFAATAAFGLAAFALAAYLMRNQPAAPVPTPDWPAVTLGSLERWVETRPNALASFERASAGQVVPLGAQVRTGPAARVRLDFGGLTQVRLDTGSLVTLERFTWAGDRLVSRLRLAYGRLWLRLDHGRLDVITPLGPVMVEGSFAEIEYAPGADPDETDDDVLVIRCLEGHCTYSNVVHLVTLQQLRVAQGGLSIVGPTSLAAADVEAFMASNPEFADVAPTLTALAPSPTPTGTATPTPTVPHSPGPATTWWVQPTARRVFSASPTAPPLATSAPPASEAPNDSGPAPTPSAPPPPATPTMPAPTSTEPPTPTSAPSPTATPAPPIGATLFAPTATPAAAQPTSPGLLPPIVPTLLPLP